jgi:hypothetical protein
MISSWLASLWSPAPKSPPPSLPATTIQQQPRPPPPPPTQVDQQDASPRKHPLSPSSVLAPRSLKQLTLFAAGAGFLALSSAITRRSVARKIKAAAPKFYQQSHITPGARADHAEGGLIALEALSLATLNTFSFGIMAAGGLAWAFDISSIDDLRARAMRHARDGAGVQDEEGEKVIEEWMGNLMGGSILAKVKDLEEKAGVEGQKGQKGQKGEKE